MPTTFHPRQLVWPGVPPLVLVAAAIVGHWLGNDWSKYGDALVLFLLMAALTPLAFFMQVPALWRSLQHLRQHPEDRTAGNLARVGFAASCVVLWTASGIWLVRSV